MCPVSIYCLHVGTDENHEKYEDSRFHDRDSDRKQFTHQWLPFGLVSELIQLQWSHDFDVESSTTCVSE
jgi:hypothetical protein